VRRLLFLGSSCIYPKFAEQPIREKALLTGPLEPTNAWYAIAKITGIKLCEALRRQHGFDAIACPAGARARPCGSFCMWMIWAKPVCLLWSAGNPARRISRS